LRNQNNVVGGYSIHLRITTNRISKYYKIQIPKKVSGKEWSGKDDVWVKPNHPFAFEITFPLIFRQLKRGG
jgi:hypothetical protein